MDGTGIENLVTDDEVLSYPTAIALDLVNRKMYWADAGTQSIHRAGLDGSNVEEIVTDLSDPYGLALDVGSGHVYWTNRNSGDIQRAALDGSDVQLLLNRPADTPGDPSAGPAEIKLDLINRKCTGPLKSHERFSVPT